MRAQHSIEPTNWIPESFGWEATILTHVSEVYLGATEVYKRKRPVVLPFVDHSFLESRVHSCFEELRLNRRLSDGVYRGVCFLLCDDSRYYFSECYQEPQPIPADAKDAVVVMRRLVATDTLRERLAAGEDLEMPLRVVAKTIAQFHRQLASVIGVESSDVLAAAEDNLVFFDEANALEPADRVLIDSLLQLQQRALLRLTAKIEQRLRDGLFRDGHGDLRLEHVYWSSTAPLQIIDCIEFSEKLRTADALSDIAFLAMELEYFKRGDLSSLLYQEYCLKSPEIGDSELFTFYKSYRALVRAKVEWISAGGADERDASLHLECARRFLSLAHRYLLICNFRPQGQSGGSEQLATAPLILIAGPIGVGKSTVARELANRLCATYLSSDEMRNEMFGRDPKSATLSYGADRYNARHKIAVYRMLADRAENALRHRVPVVVDATFSRAEYREVFVELASRCGAELRLICCRASERLIRERLATRALQRRNSDGGTTTQAPSGESDGRLEILPQHLAEFEWPEDGLRLEMEKPLSTEQLCEYIVRH